MQESPFSRHYDLLVWKVALVEGAMTTQRRAAMPSYREVRRWREKVLMLHPAADRWTPLELSLPFFERIAARKRLVMVRDAGHMPIEEPALAGIGMAFAQFVHELAPVPPPRRAPRSGSC